MMVLLLLVAFFVTKDPQLRQKKQQFLYQKPSFQNLQQRSSFQKHSLLNLQQKPSLQKPLPRDVSSKITQTLKKQNISEKEKELNRVKKNIKKILNKDIVLNIVLPFLTLIGLKCLFDESKEEIGGGIIIVKFFTCLMFFITLP